MRTALSRTASPGGRDRSPWKLTAAREGTASPQGFEHSARLSAACARAGQFLLSVTSLAESVAPDGVARLWSNAWVAVRLKTGPLSLLPDAKKRGAEAPRKSGRSGDHTPQGHTAGTRAIE